MEKDRREYVEVYSLQEGTIRYSCNTANHELEYHRTRINALRFSPNGRLIAVGDASREIKVWEIGREEPVITRKWLAHQSTVTSLSWSPEGDRLVSGSVDGRIVVWNLNAPREIHEKPGQHPGGVFCVEWTDNNVVYTCGDDACVREMQLVMCVCLFEQTPLHIVLQLTGKCSVTIRRELSSLSGRGKPTCIRTSRISGMRSRCAIT